MAPRQLILASTSQSRYSILRNAGFDPIVVPSGVDENLDAGSTHSLVLALARQKAEAVAARVDEGIVLGCDSMLDCGGESLGKPESVGAARRNWGRIEGRWATLLTGHVVIDRPSGNVAETVIATEVRFGHPSPSELDAYLETGESLGAAGGFTLEGFGAAFVEEIRGDALNVMGCSPCALRSLIAKLGYSLLDLWPKPGS